MNPSLLEQSGSNLVIEQRLILYGISWQQYETLRQTLDDVPGTRMTYLDGTLEIMTPSPLPKGIVARIRLGAFGEISELS